MVKKKFEYFEKIIKNSSLYFYEHDREKNLNSNAIKLSHLGEIKGKNGQFNLMGVIYEKHGWFYL